MAGWRGGRKSEKKKKKKKKERKKEVGRKIRPTGGRMRDGEGGGRDSVPAVFMQGRCHKMHKCIKLCCIRLHFVLGWI